MNFKTGGRKVITRLLEAYGFSTRQALCDRLGVSTSTMGTRWTRDVFPADWVIQCSIETGASVEWLSFGKGNAFQDGKTVASNEYINYSNESYLDNVVAVPCKKIIEGDLIEANFYMLDKALLPQTLSSVVIISVDNSLLIAEENLHDVTDGMWLVEIEGKFSVRKLVRIPVGNVQVSNVTTSFTCPIGDIKAIAKCHYSLIQRIN